MCPMSRRLLLHCDFNSFQARAFRKFPPEAVLPLMRAIALITDEPVPGTMPEAVDFLRSPDLREQLLASRVGAMPLSELSHITSAVTKLRKMPSTSVSDATALQSWPLLMSTHSLTITAAGLDNSSLALRHSSSGLRHLKRPATMRPSTGIQAAAPSTVCQDSHRHAIHRALLPAGTSEKTLLKVHSRRARALGLDSATADTHSDAGTVSTLGRPSSVYRGRGRLEEHVQALSAQLQRVQVKGMHVPCIR